MAMAMATATAMAMAMAMVTVTATRVWVVIAAWEALCLATFSASTNRWSSM